MSLLFFTVLFLVYGSLIEQAVMEEDFPKISEYLDGTLDESERENLATLLMDNLTLVTKVFQTNLNGFADIFLKKAVEQGNSEAIEIALMHGAKSDDSSIARDLSFCTACRFYSHASKMLTCRRCVDGKVCLTCINDSRIAGAVIKNCPLCNEPMSHDNPPLNEISLYFIIKDNINNPEYSWFQLSEMLGQLDSLTLDYTSLFSDACAYINSPENTRSHLDLVKSKFLLLLKRQGADVDTDQGMCLVNSINPIGNEFTEYLIIKVKCSLTHLFCSSNLTLTVKFQLVNFVSDLITGHGQTAIDTRSRAAALSLGLPLLGDTIEDLRIRRNIRGFISNFGAASNAFKIEAVHLSVQFIVLKFVMNSAEYTREETIWFNALQNISRGDPEIDEEILNRQIRIQVVHGNEQEEQQNIRQ
jgi:hypothetical protein